MICSIILVCPSTFALFQYFAFRGIKSHNYYYILGMIHYYEIFLILMLLTLILIGVIWMFLYLFLLLHSPDISFCQSFIFYFSEFFIVNSSMWECILILLIIASFWAFTTTLYFSLLFFIVFSLHILLLDRLGCLLFFKYI